MFRWRHYICWSEPVSGKIDEVSRIHISLTAVIRVGTIIQYHEWMFGRRGENEQEVYESLVSSKIVDALRVMFAYDSSNDWGVPEQLHPIGWCTSKGLPSIKNRTSAELVHLLIEDADNSHVHDAGVGSEIISHDFGWIT